MDFDGDAPSRWFSYNVPQTPAYSRDTDTTTFNDGELTDIRRIWERISEKFSPFDVNVTTVDPGNLDDRRTLRAVIGGDGAWAGGGYAGMAQVGGFYEQALPNTVYVFEDRLGNGDPSPVAETVAHEAGHGFGLEHPAAAGNASWAPIMSYTLNAQRRTWWSGPNAHGDVQDDMAVLAGWPPDMGLGYRADDHGSGTGAATVLATSGSTVTGSGVITETVDTDWFSFATGTGAVSLTVHVAQYGAMLDAKLELRNAAGNLVTSADNASLGETVSASVAAGTYYLVVLSHGSYGDVGQYSVSGTVASGTTPTAPVANAGGPYTVAEGGSATLSGASSTGTGLTYVWDLDGDGTFGESGAGALRGSENGTAPTFSAAGLDGPGLRTVSLRVTDSSNQTSTATATVNVTNVPRTPAISGVSSVAEGTGYTLALSSTDPGQDTVSNWLISWGDGTNSAVTGNPATVGHTYADNGAYTITATATDEDGSYSSNSLSVTVTNVAPTASLNGAAGVNEGTAYSLTLGADIDPGADTVTQFIVDWGDGVTDTYTSAGTRSHVYADGQAARTINLSLVDEDGTYASVASHAVSVTNVAPTLAASGPASVSEGAAYTLGLVSTDPGQDTITAWLINWGDGTTQAVGGGSSPLSVPHTYADHGSYTVSATTTDEDGTYTANPVSAVVTNVAPSASVGGAAEVDEGSVYSLTVSAVSDPGADTVTQFVVDWGDGTTDTYDSPGVKTHVFADGPAARTVRLSLADEDGTHTNVAATAVAVANVPPTLEVDGADSVRRTAPYVLTLGRAEPGQDTISNWSIDWGDGATQMVGGDSSAVTHTYADVGTYSVTVTATDEDGTYAAVPKVVQVTSTTPPVTISGDTAIKEGSAYQLTLAAGDGGLLPPGTWTVNWGDGVTDTFAAGAAGDTKSHRYADGDAARVISAVFDDAEGPHPAASLTVSVLDVAPTLGVAGPGAVERGKPYTIGLSYSDPGSDPIHSWRIEWGDGSVDVVVGAATSAVHTYSADGDFNVAARAIEEEGQYDTQSHRVTVTPPPPTDTTAPAASASAAALTTAGASAYTFSVTYLDGTSGIDVATVDGNDIQVRGPDGRVYKAAVAAVAGGGGGQDVTPLTVTYVVQPPDGSWKRAHNGRYALVLQGAAVRDRIGNAVAELTLGGFDVDIPLPRPGASLESAYDLGDVTAAKRSDGKTLVPGEAERFYRLTITRPVTLAVKLGGLRADASLALRDAAGNVIVESVKPGRATESVTRVVGPGTYFVQIYSDGKAPTPYKLSVSSKAVRAPRARFSGALGASAPQGLHTVTLEWPATLSLKASSNGDPGARMELVDSAGAVLAGTTDIGRKPQTSTYVAGPGTYTLRVGLAGTAAAKYKLEVTQIY